MTTLNCDLSFDPRDPYFPIPGNTEVTWALQVFTTSNGYGVDPGKSELTRVDDDRVRLTAGGIAMLGQQATAGSADIVVDIVHDDGAWSFAIEATLGEPVKSVKLVLRGLPQESLARGWWSPTSPRAETETGSFQWNYPGTEWATKWAAAGTVALSVRDERVSGAVLHVARPQYSEQVEVELVHSVPASLRSTRVSVPPIRLLLGATAERLDSDLSDHVGHAAAAFGLELWEERDDVPEWMRSTELVVTLHGQHWTGYVFNTFEQMGSLLERIADTVDPSRVLAYLPGWEGRYYFDYPHYSPGAALGGEDGFTRLAARARDLGVRLMPMFGANGANVEKYPRWQEAAIRNDSNRYPAMLNSPDWDGDRYPEGDQVFLNPGEPGFREHLVDSVSHLVENYGIDAAFFDTAGFWFNDPRFDVYEGYRQLVGELRARHPHLLLVSEGWWDGMMALFPVSQQWLGVPRDIARPAFLTDYARTTSHLAEGTPGLGSTGVHEQGYRIRPPDVPLAGHLPVVSFAGGNVDEQFALLGSMAGASIPPPTVHIPS